jgi:malate dehydrogenase (quinone)
MIPSYGVSLVNNPELLKEIHATTVQALGLVTDVPESSTEEAIQLEEESVVVETGETEQDAALGVDREVPNVDDTLIVEEEPKKEE